MSEQNANTIPKTVLISQQGSNFVELLLYQEVVLNQDFYNRNLQQGNVATLVDYVAHPEEGEDGAILEVFNAFGDTVAVVTVPESSIDALQPSDIPSIRRLVQASLKRL